MRPTLPEMCDYTPHLRSITRKTAACREPQLSTISPVKTGANPGVFAFYPHVKTARAEGSGEVPSLSERTNRDGSLALCYDKNFAVTARKFLLATVKWRDTFIRLNRTSRKM